jgi:protein-disulfide isomerase
VDNIVTNKFKYKCMSSKSVFNSFSHKMNFILGIASTIGVIGVIGFFVMLGVTFGDGEKKVSDSGSPSPSVAAAPSPTPSAPRPSAPTGPVDVQINDNDARLGPDSAKVKIVEFSDFECPFCQRFHPTMKQIRDEYGDDVQWVYKHFPLDSIHPNARPAAMAAECASEQGKFWEFGDELFANQSQMSDAYYKSLARDLGLNGSQFDSCVDSQKYADKVNADYQQGLAAGVQGTPASFINGQLISGAQPYAAVKAAVDSIL